MAHYAFNSRYLVLASVRHHGAISRVELVEKTGLSAGSISNITRELVDHGILYEVREAGEGRGRPRMALSVNAQAATLAGLVLCPSGAVQVQITDLVGTPLLREHFPVAPIQQDEDLADALADCLRQAVAQTQWNMARPYAAGVGLFGTVETASGILHWLPPAPPHPMALQAMLERRLHIPVFIDNAANLMARSESWRRPEDVGGRRHFIHIGIGIGLATTWDGAIQTGGRGVNAEFGHVKSGLAGDLPCLCGAKGCLCTVASLGGLVARDGATDVPAGNTSSRIGLPQVAPRLAEIARRARAGDPQARRLFEEAGSAMGMAVANMANVTTPNGVTLVVEDEAWIELAEPAFTRTLRANLLAFLEQDFPVAIRLDDSSEHPLGAIALVEERLFSHDFLPDWS